jgi:hypothetical protein
LVAPEWNVLCGHDICEPWVIKNKGIDTPKVPPTYYGVKESQRRRIDLFEGL